MSVDIAIVADDLTGALDTSTPFALAGRRVACAARPEGLAAAIASGAEIVVVSTASRALAPEMAAQRVRSVAEQLQAARPSIVFKKIDSRLKGNPAEESAALARALGLDRLLVAPAIPDQGRFTIDGKVCGYGVDTPLAVSPRFASTDLAIEIADAASDEDLDRIVAGADWTSTLAVGARGLGAALARLHRGEPASHFAPDGETLFAIGSRDPITERQIAALRRVEIHDAPLGALASPVTRLPAVIRSTGPFRAPDEAISTRFAAAVADGVATTRPHTLVMSGGDTALAILDQLGVDLVFPEGEAAPGLPWFLIPRKNHRSIRAVVKSGGFGDETALAALLPEHMR